MVKLCIMILLRKPFQIVKLVQIVSKFDVDGVLPEDKAKKYLYDIVLGLQYRRYLIQTISIVHLHKVVHRDIKPENILIAKDDHCKISS